jgi:glycosyltransferase involved in cell wall biosynthesis
MTINPLKVLCSIDYFLPVFAGGGPITTIANMRELLVGGVELAIFTRDRDLGATAAYGGIVVDAWTKTDQGRIFYASPDMFGVPGLKKITEQERFDLLYLNSFFSPHSSIKPYFWARRNHKGLPILLAPRGEFSTGALSQKRMKKKTYLTVARNLGLYDDIQWHASTAIEKEDILRQFPTATAIHLAEDPVKAGNDQLWRKELQSIQDGTFNIVFISRISPIKNLDGLVRILATLSFRVHLDIYGPIEDQGYWRKCAELIENLPSHLSAKYKGPLAPEAVSPTFAAYDLFAFPTLGENFGHVVFEALRASTPVLMSDRTPWKTQSTGVISALPLSDIDGWRAALERAATRTTEEKLKLRDATRFYAANYARNSDAICSNLSMFDAVAGQKRRSEINANTVSTKNLKERETRR